MNHIPRKSALQFINQQHGKLFSVVFVKRTTGETREMLCRQGVKKHLSPSGKGPAYNFSDKGLIPVFDMQKEAYRSIPKEGITKIMIHGKWYKVV